MSSSLKLMFLRLYYKDETKSVGARPSMAAQLEERSGGATTEGAPLQLKH